MRKEMERMLRKGVERIGAVEDENATLKRRLKVVEASRTLVLPVGAGGDNGKAGLDAFFSSVIRGMANGGLDNPAAWEGIEAVRDIGIASRKRALSQGSDAAGGFVVPPEYIASLIEELVNRTAVLAAGATQMTGLTGAPVEIPRLAAGATAQWIGENLEIPDDDQTFDQVLMNPHLGTARTIMSRRVAAMSNPAIEGIVRSDLAGAVARLQDSAALYGTGVTVVPLGIKPQVTPIPAAGDITVDLLYDTLYALEAANADLGSIAWIMNPREFNTLRKARSAVDGQYLLTPNPGDATRMMLLGYPVFITNQVAIDGGVGVNEGDVFLGNWSDLLWGQWGGVIIEATTEGGAMFENHEVMVKVVVEQDYGLRHVESFQVIDGIIPA